MAAAANTPTTMPAIAPPDKWEPLPVSLGALLGEEVEMVVAAVLVVLVEDVVAVEVAAGVEAMLEGTVPLFTTTNERISDPAAWLSHGHGSHV